MDGSSFDDSFDDFVRWKKCTLDVVEPKEEAMDGARRQEDGDEPFASPLLLGDEEILALGISQANIEMFRRLRYQDSFSISAWYRDLQDLTFPSFFVELSEVIE